MSLAGQAAGQGAGQPAEQAGGRVDAEGIGLHRGSVLLGLAVWLGASFTLAVLTLRSTALPGASLAAALVGLATAAAVTGPLHRGRSRAGPGTAVLGAVAVPAVALANAALVHPQAAATYALWFPGLVSTAVGGLAVRHRPVAASVAALGSLAVLGWLAQVRLHRPDALAWALVASTPVLLWWMGGLVVARMMSLSQLELRRSDSRTASARARRDLARALAADRDRREALLARGAVPLLEVVAAGADDGSEDDGRFHPRLRERLRAVDAELRAEIRGRALLDDVVRAAASDARARGLRVSVIDDAPPGADPSALPLLRELVAVVLGAGLDGEVTARRPSAGAGLTVVHRGSPPSRRAVSGAAAALAQRRGLRGLDLQQDDDAAVVDLVL